VLPSEDTKDDEGHISADRLKQISRNPSWFYQSSQERSHLEDCHDCLKFLIDEMRQEFNLVRRQASAPPCTKKENLFKAYVLATHQHSVAVMAMSVLSSGSLKSVFDESRSRVQEAKIIVSKCREAYLRHLEIHCC
jgi:hypothetical protein